MSSHVWFAVASSYEKRWWELQLGSVHAVHVYALRATPGILCDSPPLLQSFVKPALSEWLRMIGYYLLDVSVADVRFLRTAWFGHVVCCLGFFQSRDECSKKKVCVWGGVESLAK